MTKEQREQQWQSMLRMRRERWRRERTPELIQRWIEIGARMGDRVCGELLKAREREEQRP